MRLRGIVIVGCLLAWPTVAAAQSYADPQGDHSVIRPAGYGWRNQVLVPDGPCGCAMPVRADCYDVCRPCGLRPLCFIKRVARTLDCLLPCNLCCHGGGYGGGPLHGCVLGNRWGHGIYSNGCVQNPAGSCFDDFCGAGPGCASPIYGRQSCGCQSCTSTVPALSDPFQDDPLPLPPTPIPNPAREVRRTPTPQRSVMTPQRTTPPRTTQPGTTPQRVTSQRAAAARPAPAAPAPRATSPYKITTTGSRPAVSAAQPARRPLPPSVLRQTSHDREPAEPAPHWIDQAHARPLIRSQSPPEEPADLAIPYNPLRAR